MGFKMDSGFLSFLNQFTLQPNQKKANSSWLVDCFDKMNAVNEYHFVQNVIVFWNILLIWLHSNPETSHFSTLLTSIALFLPTLFTSNAQNHFLWVDTKVDDIWHNSQCFKRNSSETVTVSLQSRYRAQVKRGSLAATALCYIFRHC